MGYHGSSIEEAEDIIASGAWRQSENRYDWLGNGVYFWEFGYDRAMEWARRHHGSSGVVIEADLRLGRCVNLLDTTNHLQIVHAYHLTQHAAQLIGTDLPTNRTDGRHYLDRVVVEMFCRRWELVSTESVQAIRGCFPEGQPVFPGSKILSHTHVQIAIRDVSCIESYRLVRYD